MKIRKKKKSTREPNTENPTPFLRKRRNKHIQFKKMDGRPKISARS